MYGYNDLKVSAPHKVGVFKYVIGYNRKHEPGPMEIWVEECQLNVTRGYDEYDDGTPMRDVVNVKTKYKVNYRGKAWWVKPDEIFDTKEEVLSKIEYEKNNKV